MITDKNRDELKLCPFCGSTEHLEVIHADELRDDGCTSYNGDAYTVVCNYLTGGCGATCGFVTGKKETAKKWNTRTAERLAKIEAADKAKEWVIGYFKDAAGLCFDTLYEAILGETVKEGKTDAEKLAIAVKAFEVIRDNTLNPAHTMTKLGLEETTDANHLLSIKALKEIQ